MGNRLFHYIYMDIITRLQTDEGRKELEAEAMGSSGLSMAMMMGMAGGSASPTHK